MASAPRVGTLRGCTAIILLTGFLGALDDLLTWNFVYVLVGLGLGRWHWMGRGGTTGELRARTGCVAARWAKSARPTLHLVLRAVGGTPQGAVWALLAHGGARERGGVRYAP